MKLTTTLTILTLSVSAFAQTTTPAAPKTTTKPPVHHTTTAVHHTAAAAAPTCATTTTMSDKIPAVTGCAKPLYALSYIDTVIGTGEPAVPRKWYTVHYTGYLLDGTKFDSSVDRGQPFTFPYGAHQVIAGWDTGFEGMHVGGKRRLFVPYQLAYGEAGHPPAIPEKSELIFDVELIAISDQPPAPPAQPTETPKQ